MQKCLWAHCMIAAAGSMLLLLLLLLLPAGSSAAPVSLQACKPGFDSFPFCDTRLSVAERAKDLVSRMTVSEKIAQMGNNATGVARLGLPRFDWWTESLHGLNAGCAPDPTAAGGKRCPSSFPSGLNMASSFNMELVHAIGVAISDEVRAAYNIGLKTWRYFVGLDVWSPNINIFRDPRWGRGQETPGEDPYLSGRYATAMIRGLQDSSDPRYLKLVATPKHFAAYSLERYDGVDRTEFDANVTAQDLSQTFLPAFEAAVRDGDAHGIMCSYNAVNGVPSCASTHLLRDKLRLEWKFDGYVTGDCWALGAIKDAHHFVSTGAEAAAISLLAGTDTDCADGEGRIYQTYLQDALDQGLVTEYEIDESLIRLYSLQMRLGMFDPEELLPYRHFTVRTLDSPEHRVLAKQMARESLVLLRNEKDILPLTIDPRGGTPLRIALIGPHAASTEGLTSNYHGALPHVVSVLEALNISGVALSYEKGCDINSTDTSGISAAVEAAADADVAVVVLGIDTTIENEWLDRTELALPGQQNTLLARILNVQQRTVVVLVNGGVVGVETVLNAAAIIEAFYPGEEGGSAIADVLLGRYNPSGRLPVTMYPSNFTETADFFNYDMRQPPGLTYRFYQQMPMFEFGFGLSFTTFEFFIDSVTQILPAVLDAEAKLRVRVSNRGARDGDVSVLGFMSLVSASSHAARRGRNHHQHVSQLGDPACPLRQLFAFQKVFLRADDSVWLTFRVTPRDAFCVDDSGRPIARTGTYRVTLGDAGINLYVR